MGFLFGEPKMDREELTRCLEYLGEHYKLTTFQEKEADLYNESLVQYMPTLATNKRSAEEMVKVAERFKQAAHELSKRSKQLVSVPESVGALHFAWQIVFADYTAWVDAQYAAYVAISQDSSPYAERVQALFRQQEESHKKALKEEKKLLKRLRASGLGPSDIQSLVDKAFAAIEAENWQPKPSMTDEITKRKKAYQYMVKQVKGLMWDPPIDSDKRLAETLDIPISELNSLKEGLSNPTEKMVAAFKSFLCPGVSETDVDLYLVKPFLLTRGVKDEI